MWAEDPGVPLDIVPVQAAPGPYVPSEKAPTATEDKEEPVHVSADRMIHLAKKNLVKAIGHVQVEHGPRRVRADQMILNTETGQGEAVGDVVMEAEDGTVFRAKRAKFNIKSQRGQFFDVDGQVAGGFLVKGREVRKLSRNHYQAKDAFLTTCKGEVPDWAIEVKETDLILEDRAWFKGGVFKIRNFPLIYLPIGYVPLDTERKTGFIMPEAGISNLDGVLIGPRYFWAINKWSDATLGIDYMTKRGVRGLLETRYHPSRDTQGQFNGVFLDDRVTGNSFWKVDATHRQKLPYGFNLNAKLDQTSKANFNKTFRNQTENRTRRSSDSFMSLFGSWENQSFDILTRFRKSEEAGRDDTFGLLPSATYKTQSIQLGGTNFYFDQEANYTNFLLDIDPDPDHDDLESIHRADFHPQLSWSWNIAPWMQFTTKGGFRQTYYSKEVQFDPVTKVKTERGGFSRELFDLNATLEGPKFNKVFLQAGDSGPAFKHVIEPRLVYDYIPSMDENDRAKIRVIDAVDALPNTNRLTYFFTQRLLRKDYSGSGSPQTRQVARFEISQSYDFLEATRFETAATPRRPFSGLRFDFDSRLTDNFMLNFDTTLDIYDGEIDTYNIDIGIRPTSWLMLILERRNIRDVSDSMLGTLDLTLPKGWNLKYSARYDEFRSEFLEHNGRLTFNNNCECWGFSLDVIQRNNINGDIRTSETKFLLSIQLRGLGEMDNSRGESFLHRTF